MKFMKFTKKEWIIFFAGAQTLHTVSHILLAYSGTLPIQFFSYIITEKFNGWAIVINALITGWLLWWASKTKK